MILIVYSDSHSSKSANCFFIFSHSKFDVGRWMFDVDFFKVNTPALPGAENNSALMGFILAPISDFGLSINIRFAR